MTEITDRDRGVGQCNECGHISPVFAGDSGPYMVGTAECPKCGSCEMAEMIVTSDVSGD